MLQLVISLRLETRLAHEFVFDAGQQRPGEVGAELGVVTWDSIPCEG
jgi:hypothetical protein